MKQILIILVLLTLGACYSGNSYEGAAQMESYANEASLEEADYQGVKVGDTDASQVNVAPKLIRTASIVLEVEDYTAARAAFGQLLEKYEARLASEQERRNSYSIENTIRIRVNPDQLNAVLSDLEKLAYHVSSKSVQTDDVTRQYVDLETRLASKRAVVEQYRSILKKATTIQDILAVEDKLRQVVEEIESSEGQLRYLKDQVSLSTIDATLVERIETKPAQRRSFISRVGRAFGNGWEGLGEFTIGLVSAWPFILILAGLLYLIRRFWKRRKRV
ncbi:MAG: DUF4349 domain-containing protein [Bacteroidota bacterium]